MAFSDLIRELKALGCETSRVTGVSAHVLLTNGAFRAIVPALGPEESGVASVTGPPPDLPYSVTLTPDSDGTVLVTFPDFPGATFGRTEAEALARAADFLRDAVAIFEAIGESVPARPAQTQVRRSLPPAP